MQIIDEHDTDDLGKFVYTAKRNGVWVEHEDGTIMRYAGLEKNSFKVKVGQTVFPGDELGLNARVGENSYRVSCLLSYINITPQFAVNTGAKEVLKSRNTYTAFIDDALIMQEMSKRERKRYKK